MNKQQQNNINKLEPKRNGGRFADNIFKYIFWKKMLEFQF